MPAEIPPREEGDIKKTGLKEQPGMPIIGTMLSLVLRSAVISLMANDTQLLYPRLTPLTGTRHPLIQIYNSIAGIKSGFLGFLGFSLPTRLAHFLWGLQDWRSFIIVTGQELLSSLSMGAAIGYFLPFFCPAPAVTLVLK